MDNENQEPEYRHSNILGVLIALLIGCLTGAATMLLLAPQSGKATRTQIQKKGIELRDRTTEMVDGAMAELRLDRDKIAIGGRQKAQELIRQGQALAAEQLGRVADAAQAGKKAIQSS